MTEREKDEIAAMVLKVVQAVVRGQQRYWETSYEPTSTGWIGDDVRQFIEHRGAA